MGVCSIIGRNLPLYGVIRVVKRVVAGAERVCAAAMVAQWLRWRGGGGGGCNGGAVVVVERVCAAVMAAQVLQLEKACAAAV